MTDKFLKEKEASELSGLKVSWLRRKRFEKSGPPYVKLGTGKVDKKGRQIGLVLYKESELIAWLDAQQRPQLIQA